MGSATRLILVGVSGYGRIHAARIAELATAGRVELVAAVDPAFTEVPRVAYGVPVHDSLPEALAAAGTVDVVVIAAPIGFHFGLAEIALRAGADVLLEKPPVASMADFLRLLELEESTGRVVQVGFQSLGSDAITRLVSDAYDIGPTRRVSAYGAWSRTLGYWSRSSWAGKRTLNGHPIIDGVGTNALAHAVATALAVAGCRRLADVDKVETDLYRVNKIDADDTSVLRITTATGLVVTCALTLCAEVEQEPMVRVEGTTGRAVLAYKLDQIDVETPDRSFTETTARTDLLENLLDHRNSGAELLVPLASTGAFMRVLAAIADADEPVKVDPRAVRWTGEGAEQRPIIADIEQWLARAADEGKTFAELEVPWAHRGHDRIVARAQVEGDEVAEYRDGAGIQPTSSPRPYLHPVRTRAGVVVTAHHAGDHDWHNGIGVVIPDVDGTSFWGGGTYVHGEGYVLLDNHGRVVGDEPEVVDDGFDQQLSWLGPDGSPLLREQRSVRWAPLDPKTWRLSFSSELIADAGATLASPGSKGRVDAGYGGFFWRLPACREIEVFTASEIGEDAVNGSVSPWLAWSADFAAEHSPTGPATIVVVGAEAAAAGDPWFVRAAGYPGIGSALAWDEAVTLEAGGSLSRRFEIAVADGRLSAAEVEALVSQLLAPVS